MRHAFSLVELSIVLVILGLLTGGILGGQALIRAAELRSVSSEFERYATARATFRDKYFALPGDMANATAFWGAADGATGVSATCYATASTGMATCNGNGNGQLDWGNTATSAETYRYWQHLANAGLIEGQYNGAPNGAVGPNMRQSVRGQNIPASKLGQAAWYTEWAGPQPLASLWAWEGDYGNPLYFGVVVPTDIPEHPALTPSEAWNIDTKMDDGRPAQGRMRTYKNNTSCNSNLSASTAEYLLSSTSLGCNIVILLGS